MLDDLEGFQLIWKVSKLSGNFQPGKTLYNLEVYNQSGKFPDSLKRQRYVNTWTKSLKSATNKVCKKCNILVAITIYALLAFMPRKRFTRFVRKVFAHKSVPTGKLRLFRPLEPPSPVVLGAMPSIQINLYFKTCSWDQQLVF